MLGEILRQLREQAGVTQDFMATLLCIKRQSYSAYERNVSSPDATTLRTLANYFNVSADYLLSTDFVHRTNQLDSLPEKQSQLIVLYEKLDTDDQAEIRGEIKGMLRHEKYATLEERRRHA